MTLKKWIVFSYVCSSLMGTALAKQNIPSLSEKLNKTIKQSNISSKHLGISLSTSEDELYQMNSQKSFIPASLIKIFTASALLNTLPATMTFKTQFLINNEIVNGTLNGHLYLQGGGDPGFVSESLWNLVNNLNRTGLKHINGNLIVDDSRFQTENTLQRQTHFSYDAPSGALSFNWNTVNIYLKPALSVKPPLQIDIDPFDLYFLGVKNNTTTASSRSPKDIVVERKKQSKKLRESLHIKGKLPLNHREVLIYRNILYPAIWTGWNTTGFLKQRDIQLNGTVQTGITPDPSITIAEWEGKPLIEDIRLMMKYSNNYMVEMLIKNMVTESKQTPGNLADGIQIIKNHIEELGIETGSYTIIEATGLSHKNRVTPRQLSTVLKYWENHPLQAEFESCFPLSGMDGTLKKRFTNTPLKSMVHAKTGSLKDVTGLAGYFRNKKKQKIFFAFLFNGSDRKKIKAERLFEQLLEITWNHN